MAEQVEDKAVELMDRFPEVVDAVLWVARIDALRHFGVSFMLVLFGSIILYYNSRIWGWCKEQAEASDGMSYFISTGYSAVCATLLITASIRLFDPWPWVGIIEPQLWIAKRVLGL